MQRRSAAWYALFFVIVVLCGYVTMAAAEPVPVSDSPAHTVTVGENITINSQQYALTGIATTAAEGGGWKRKATFNNTDVGKSVSFGDSEVISMPVVDGGVPRFASYTSSLGTIKLGGEDYGAYYPNNNTVSLMTKDVYNHEVSSLKTLSDRFQGIWATVYLGLIAVLIVISISYLPRRG